MIILQFCNGGLLFMIYPILVFGYGIVIDREPGPLFWYFVVIYTQILLITQYLIQMNLFFEY